MVNEQCIFCKIIHKQLPSTIIHETKTIIVIKDLYPKAPIHYLIIPKLHKENFLSLTEQDKELAWDLLKTARDIAQNLEKPKAFNIIANNGAQAGQSVPHLHLHFLAGKNIYTSDAALAEDINL